ncbi:MAG: hypothetical protein ACSLEW_14185 [Nocardioides sp.]
MELTSEVLAELLQQQIDRGVAARELARWAHDLYLSHSPLTGEVTSAFMSLVVCEEGPEFALTRGGVAAIIASLRSGSTDT